MLPDRIDPSRLSVPVLRRVIHKFFTKRWQDVHLYLETVALAADRRFLLAELSEYESEMPHVVAEFYPNRCSKTNLLRFYQPRAQWYKVSLFFLE